jgi:LysM repeat protein
VDSTTLLIPTETPNVYTRVNYKRDSTSLCIDGIQYLQQIPTLKRTQTRLPKEEFMNANELIVKKGYSLLYISRMFDIPMKDLIELNHLSPPYNIREGEIIRLY